MAGPARTYRGVGVATALVMAVLVVLAYAAAVAIDALFGAAGPPSLAVSVVVTAVVALAFEPVRTRTRRWLARLAHADGDVPAPALAGFGDAVAGHYPVTELPDRIAAVVGEGIGAWRCEVWLMVDGRLERAAAWAPAPADPPDGEPGRHELDVRDRGELLGRLVLITAADHRLTPLERRLVEGVAAQSGLLLRVAALRVQLERKLADRQQRAAELRRARRDLVARQDAERKRLERNIHDGAQQEVIALLVNLRLVQTLLGRAPDRALGLLAGQDDAFASTVRSLEELAHGLHPKALTEQGPVAALRQAVARGPIPVDLTADPLPRLPAEVEATVYFGVVEALQNAAKHARAQRISVDLRFDGVSGVAVAIADDGVGFDAARAGTGRGLANIRDRVESVGGRLRLESAPGRGTRLDIELPTANIAG